MFGFDKETDIKKLGKDALILEIANFLIDQGYDDAHYQHYVMDPQLKRHCFFYEVYNSSTNKLSYLKILVQDHAEDPFKIEELAEKPFKLPKPI